MAVKIVNEQCLLLRLGDEIDFEMSDRVVAAATTLKAHFGDQLQDLTPSYASILLTFKAGMLDIEEAAKAVADLLDKDALDGEQPQHKAQCLDVPVFYHASVAPDLDEVCQRTGLSLEQLIQRHSERSYRIFAIGFAPGFCFLGPIDPSLRLPRKATPRSQVPAGSVAIAEQQTAVYPRSTPGGWHIIGRTAIDVRELILKTEPAVRIGDHIRFVPMTQQQWDQCP